MIPKHIFMIQKVNIMRRNFFIATLLAVAGTIFLFSCKNDDTPEPNGGTAKVTMRLTDAPGDYDAVYIDIQKVEVTVEGSAAIELTPVRPGIYNLLDFRNGLDTLLVQADIPAGKVGQIRLILGNNNSVVVNGQTHALTTPSGQQSGIKLNLQETLVAGSAYVFWIDFDAGKSIVETGSGKYNLKPVIRAYSATTDGQVKGYVLPAAALTTVYITDGVDTYTAIPNPDGFFIIKGLPQGTYSVTFDASVALYTDVTLSNINVTYGQVTDLGVTTLVQ